MYHNVIAKRNSKFGHKINILIVFLKDVIETIDHFGDQWDPLPENVGLMKSQLQLKCKK